VRLRHPDGTTVHLSYCSNVHPAEDVDGIVAQLSRFAGPVRRAMGSDLLGVGLWIPAGAARTLAADTRQCDRLRSALVAEGLEVVTLNGFPYGGFHDPVVKRAVYRPDWTEPDRLAYTLDLARVLAALLPDDVAEGTISTLPLGWREGWSEASTRAALSALARLGDELSALRDRTGRTIRVGLEPEPGCIVERTGHAAELLAGAVTGGWVGVCLDACHLAVQFEDPSDAVRGLAAAGVPIVKAQVSTALRVPNPAVAPARRALSAFVEPRFLHQTRVRRGGPGGPVEGVDDLDEALAGRLADDGEWRVHFHAPVHWRGAAAGEQTTQAELCSTLDVLVGGPEPLTTHLDVETYTWTVLPAERRPAGPDGLVDGLARELRWTRSVLAALGLSEAVGAMDVDAVKETP
jgi:sugar phosphate isomerase/epimerase